MKKVSLFTKIFSFILLLIGAFSYVSCTRDVLLAEAKLNLPDQPFNYINAKENGVSMDIRTRITDDTKKSFNNNSATLGRVLFYDKVMSINNTVACGSCHIQSLAFADGSKFSTGFANKKTTRNSLSITNPAQNNKMFWDNRAESPYELSLMPVFNHLEMGMESDEMLIEKIRSLDYYPELFSKAFGSSEVTKEKISLALSTFLNSMYSKNSKFDAGFNTSFTNYTAEEKLGRDLFTSAKYACQSCHASDNFNSPSYYNHFSTVSGTANIGLDKVYADKGADDGSFKIPSLRNIALTGPYMHDGRYATLEEVLNHYAHGVQDNAKLDPRFRNSNGSIKRIDMSETEQKAIVAFLNTLTDFSFIADPKFSSPFN